MAVAVDATEVIVARSQQEADRRVRRRRGRHRDRGGTIVMPESPTGACGRARPLPRRGRHVRREQRRTAHDDRRDDPGRRARGRSPPRSARARGRVADREIRAQATLGGNLCAPGGDESPRGDLQAALIALGAQVRSTGAGGERTEPRRGLPRRRLRRAARPRRLLPRARGRRPRDRPPPPRPRLHGARASARRARATASAWRCPAPARTACAARRSRRPSPAATPRPRPARPSTTRPPTTTRSPPRWYRSRCCPCSCAAPSTDLS